MDTITNVVKWIGEHSNKVRAAIWSVLLLALALHYVTLDDTQMGVIGLALSNLLDLFVESNTVSKVRVGERITEGIAANAASNSSSSNVSAFTSTRHLLVILAVGGALMAGCGAKGPVVLTAADSGVYTSLMRAKTGIDSLCSQSQPVLSVDSCKPLYSALTPALETGQALNRSIREGNFEGLADLATKVSALMNAVKTIPPTLRGTLEADLVQALGFVALHKP